MTAHPTHRRSGRQFHQKRLLLVLVVLAATSVVVYAGHRVQVNRQAPALLERGRAAADEKSWKAAIEAFNQYLRLRPRDSGAHIDRADAFAATRRYKDAVDGYLEGLAHEPDRLDARRKLADIYHAAGKSSATREQVMKLLGPSGKTNDPALYLLLADCAFWDKKPADERKYLEAAVALPGAAATASYRFADRIREMEKSPQAIAGPMRSWSNSSPHARPTWNRGCSAPRTARNTVTRPVRGPIWSSPISPFPARRRTRH